MTFPKGAILLRPGAPTRAGEVDHVRAALAAHHPRLLEMTGPGYADGGDVLRIADRVVIGLSDRTDRTGAEELAGLLGELGYRAEIAETPPGVLHFKTGCGLIADARSSQSPRSRHARSLTGSRSWSLHLAGTPPPISCASA